MFVHVLRCKNSKGFICPRSYEQQPTYLLLVLVLVLVLVLLLLLLLLLLPSPSASTLLASIHSDFRRLGSRLSLVLTPFERRLQVTCGALC